MGLEGIEAVVGSCCLFLVPFTQVFGSFIIWGNICVYITSYLRLFDPTITLDDTMLILPLVLLAISAVTYLGSRLTIRYGVKM
jgi:hypothetical protein